MLKAYAFGLFSAAFVVLLVAVLWFGVQPKQEPGLLWGDKVYETREQFDGYLKSKGLSYKTWLARNPGVAPWEPESFTLGAITVEASPKKVQLLSAVVAWLLATCGAVLLLRDRDSGTRGFTRTAAAMFSVVLAAVLVAGFWYGTQPRQKPGLLWGGTVYTSKEQFNLYLRAKGLSYKTWLARNPGAAPWEPAPAPRAKAREAVESPATTKVRRAANARAAGESNGSVLPSWLLPALGFSLVTAGAALLIRRRGRVTAKISRPAVRIRIPRAKLGNWGAAVSAAAIASARLLGRVTLRALRGLRASAQILAPRLGRASRAVAQPLLQFARVHAFSTGDVVFALLAVVSVAAFGAFVVLVLTV